MIGGLQRLLRQAFMAVEGVFNRAFGDRYNPLYHLGATAFFLVMAGIGLFLVTSAVGRAWCGYACPQTVWTEVFIAMERWCPGIATRST